MPTSKKGIYIFAYMNYRIIKLLSRIWFIVFLFALGWLIIGSIGILQTISSNSEIHTEVLNQLAPVYSFISIVLIGIIISIFYIRALNNEISDPSQKSGILSMQPEEGNNTDIIVSIYKMAVQNSPVSVVITDSEGRIVYVNPKFEEVTGYTAEEAIGNNPRILKSGMQDAEFYKNLWNTITSGKTWQGDFHNKKKNGEVYWELASISPIMNPENKITHYVAVKDDITDRKQTEYDLLIAKNNAENANRLKSEFIANISHEIRTPMNAILGFSNILLKKCSDSEELKDYLSGIDYSGKSLLSLINDILDLSKIESGKIEIKPTALNLSSFINDTAGIFKQKISEKNLNLKVEIQDNIPEAFLLDELRLRQIMFNLIGNAVKFTDAGEIKISCSASMNQETKHYSISFEVSDTGIGIPKDQLEIIFEPFSQQRNQNDAKFEGTGLGLSICKRLSEIMNGTISVISAPGEGSTFTLTISEIIPAEKKKDNGSRMSDHKKDIHFNGQRILLVGISSTDSLVIKGLLEGKNLILSEISSAMSEMPLKQDSDLMLIDLSSKNDIEQFTKSAIFIKSQQSGIPIILISTTDPIDIQYITKFSGYISKPISEELLVKTISEQLGNNPIAMKPERPEKSREIPATFTKSLSSEQISIINKNVVSLLKEVKKTHSVSTIKELSEELISIAQSEQIEEFASIGESLKSSLTTYNFAGIISILDNLENLVAGLKKS